MPVYSNLDDFVRQWTQEGKRLIGATMESDETFEDILVQIEFMAEYAYSRYVPAMYSKYTPIFQDRMVAWLQNPELTEQDRIALFQLLLRLAYFSFDDFISLYRTAYSNHISRWVWDCLGLDMDDPEFSTKLENERSRHTWYASVSDSLIISEFYHANSITGIKCRPNFMTLHDLGNPNQIKDYMALYELKRLVLLEDFVGSGTQAYRIVRWAVENTCCPVLFCPMLICPDGLSRFLQLAPSLPQLTVDAVVKLGDSVFLSTRDKRDAVLNHVAKLVDRVHAKLADGKSPSDPPYTSHGFHRPGDCHTGATVVMFSNTPDNTIPIVHYGSSDWVPIFPRVSRETL